MSELPERTRKIIEGARQGKALSQFQLGLLYEQGWDGVEQNLAEAQYWFGEAAAQGYERAQRYLERYS